MVIPSIEKKHSRRNQYWLGEVEETMGKRKELYIGIRATRSPRLMVWVSTGVFIGRCSSLHLSGVQSGLRHVKVKSQNTPLSTPHEAAAYLLVIYKQQDSNPYTVASSMPARLYAGVQPTILE
eukprot:scaffold421348_cov18-Prasinocladus_malaysianus.AAC.1